MEACHSGSPSLTHLNLFSWLMLVYEEKAEPVLIFLGAGVGESKHCPHFLAFDFVFIKGNGVFSFMACVYDFEPGTCPPGLLLYPVSRVAVLGLCKTCQRVFCYIKGQGSLLEPQGTYGRFLPLLHGSDFPWRTHSSARQALAHAPLPNTGVPE